MLHAPTSEKKIGTESSRTQQAEPEMELERQVHLFGLGWPARQSSVGSGESADTSFDRHRAQLAKVQQTYGNQAVLRIMGRSPTVTPSPLSQVGVLQRKCACGNSVGLSGTCAECQKKGEEFLLTGIQTKLRVSQPSDEYEQEADRIADQVMRMPESSIQRQIDSQEEEKEEEEEEGIIQTKSTTDSTRDRTATVPAPSIVHEVLRSPGKPMTPATRSFMEPRFGYDFSKVRIYTDPQAVNLAQVLNARAFAIHQNIIFGRGYYAPETTEGRRLLAHELAHTIQQGGVSRRVANAINAPSNPPSSKPVQITETVAPDIARTPLNVAEIMNDIRDGVSTPPELFSWLHVMGNRSGEIGLAADFPTGSGPDPSPVPTVPDLPIEAHFFPSFRRHTDQRALIVGGFHGDERPGYEVADALVTELSQGTIPSSFTLAFHTLVVPRLNRGAIEDDLAGVTSYDRRCNRQLVDLNRNLPIPGGRHTSPRCRNTSSAPTQPETDALVNVINQFQPHRILSTHAISNPRRAGVFADPNTHPTATQLACSMAGLIVDPSDRPANRIRGTRCNAVYPGDTPGQLPRDATFGAYAPTRSIPGQVVSVITLEAPEYHSLGTGTGARTVEAFLRPVRGFLSDPTLLSDVDRSIVQDIEALALPSRRLFLTGRQPAADRIYRRVRSRITAQVAALNALTPRPPNRVTALPSHRLFATSVAGGSPQSRIVFEKFTLTGGRRRGWDTLPDRYFIGGVRSRGVDRAAWLGESSATRLDIILRFSAVPGASRHHWGTDVDFNSTTNADWGATTGSGGRPGRFYRLGVWLATNAPRVGFVKTYTAGRTGGHQEEAWHYSYAPIAASLRAIYNRDVRLQEDIVDPIMADWATRATRAGVTLPSDLRTALLGLNLSSYVNTIGPGL